MFKIVMLHFDGTIYKTKFYQTKQSYNIWKSKIIHRYKDIYKIKIYEVSDDSWVLLDNF